MSLRTVFPLWIVELRRPGGAPKIVPLMVPAPFAIGRTVDQVAAELRRAITEDWMDHGRYAALLSAVFTGPPDTASIELALPQVDLLRPGLRLRFDAVVGPTTSGWAAFAPAIDAEGAGPTRSDAIDRVREAILDQVARLDLREDPRRIAEVQWWTELALHRVDLELDWWTFPERRRRAEERARHEGRLLAACADPMGPDRAYELGSARAELRRVVLGRVTAGVVVVGPQGAGKTALIADEAHAADSAFRALGLVHTTTAARLEHALTRGGPWQPWLGRLCAELHRDRIWLHVADLAELFEVGRYEGNDVSLGEYLRPWLARGEIAVVTECTPEALATVEARYPGWLECFARVQLPVVDDAQLRRIVAAWSGPAGIDPDAGDEAIRLQRRFVPYSGFPGRTIRFLAALRRTETTVRRADVTARFCEESGIPPMFVDPAVPLSHDALRAAFSGALFGQPHVVDALTDVATAVKADLTPRGRPIASLLLTGPTGVGKTEAARALATVMFGARDRLVRFDLSEFSTPDAVLRLTHAADPRGEGRLTGAIRRQPFAVVLLDELEKAHPDFFDLLLQVLGEGRLTDHRGRVADFCSAIVVMTSNLGADRAMRPPIGLTATDHAMGDALRDAVHRAFRPELVNRIDRLIPFAPLDPDAVSAVLDRELAALRSHPVLVERSVRLEVTAPARALLAALGYDPARGARPLQRVVRERVVRPIAAALNLDPRATGIGIGVDREGDELVVRAGPPTPTVDDPHLEPIVTRIRAARRDLQRHLAGSCVQDHAGACALAERQARIAAQRGEFADPGQLHRMRAPLVALDRALNDALALEAAALAPVLGFGGAAPGEGALATVRSDGWRAAVAIWHAVHPEWSAGHFGLYCPADAPPAPIEAWFDQIGVAARSLGLTTVRRHLWSKANGALIDTDPALPRPPEAVKWVGEDVWASGPGAALFVAPAEGLYDVAAALDRTDGARAWILVGTPATAQLASCCTTHRLGSGELAERKPSPGKGAPPIARWEPSRPPDPLRRATYDGKCRPWPPPGPSLEAFTRDLGLHLASR